MKESNNQVDEINNDLNIVVTKLDKYQTYREDRVKTFLTLQGLLFVALSFSWEKHFLSILISISGCLSTIAFVSYIYDIEKTIKNLVTWCQRRQKSLEQIEVFPILDIWKREKNLFFIFSTSMSMLTFSFGFLWGVIITFKIFSYYIWK